MVFTRVIKAIAIAVLLLATIGGFGQQIQLGPPNQQVKGLLPNANLANDQVTVNTTAPLAGGGAVVLGSSITLTCPTCGGGGGGSGTVTSVAMDDVAPLFTCTVSTPTVAAHIVCTISNSAAHTYYGNNTAGSTAPAFHVIDYTELSSQPTLAQTIANVAHKWINSYDATTGLFTQTQPDYTDITNTPTLPANTTGTAHQFFSAYNSTTGAFTKTQPACGDLSDGGTLCSSSATLAQTIAAVSHKWINAYNAATGSFAATQPSCGDLSDAGSGCTGTTSSGGTVTSVGLSLPIEFSVSGSPVTVSGSFSVTWATEAANTVFAGPTSGIAATPGFRALVAADIPNIAESQVTNLVSDLALKAPLASPALTGTPTAPTAAAATNTTQIASTAFVETEISNAVATGGTADFFAYGGDGSDNALHYDGVATVLGMAPVTAVYTLTRDIFGTSCTIDANDGSGHTVQIITNNFAIYCTGTLTVSGTIQNNGATGTQGITATSATGGIGGNNSTSLGAGSSTAHYTRLVTGIAGTAGGNGGTTTGTQAGVANSGTPSSPAVDNSGTTSASGNAGGVGGTGTSGAGGAARSGAAAGAISSVAAMSGHNTFMATNAAYKTPGANTWTQIDYINGSNGGAPGGSGGGGDTTNSGGGGGGGGAEGGGGGIIGIFAYSIIVNGGGVISANGGTGGVGGNGRTQTVGNVGGGGGGAGGSGGRGGIIWLVYHKLTNSGTIQAIGGTHGTGGSKGSPHGTGTDNAGAGANGPDGPAGIVIKIPN